MNTVLSGLCGELCLQVHAAATNPGPHQCPESTVLGAGFVCLMTVPPELQGYVLKWKELERRGFPEFAVIVHEIFWILMKARPEWKTTLEMGDRIYLTADWQVMIEYDNGDQD